MTVAVGDVVTLRSGGFHMTVAKVNDEQKVLCMWCAGNQQFGREIFDAKALVVVESVKAEEKETKVCEGAAQLPPYRALAAGVNEGLFQGVRRGPGCH